MLRTLLIAIILAIPLATPGFAGAWLREQGGVFLAPTFTMEEVRGRTGQSTHAGLYAEWGVGPSLTLGADLGRSGSGDLTGVLFARIPLIETAQGIRTAAEIGIGVRDGPGSSAGFLRPGVSLGYGFGSRVGNGWAALDVFAEIGQSGHLDRSKIDLTVGMSFTDRLKAMAQLHYEKGSGVEQTTFVPSIVWRTGKRQQLVFGLISGRGGRRTKGLKLALWQEF